MLGVVAGMTAGSVQHHPADLLVGQLFSALPGRAGEMGQRMKRVDPFRRLIQFAIAALPARSLGRDGLFLRPGLHEPKSEPEFFRVGRALICQYIQPPDTLFRAGTGLDFGALGQVARLLNGEGAVHEKQGLLRHRRGEPLWTGRVRTGEIEGAEHTGEVLSLDKAVNGPAIRGEVVDDVHCVSAGGQIEIARQGKEGVAGFLEVESLAVHFPKQPVVRVQLRAAALALAALLIRAGKEDEPMQLLQGPPLIHEAGGEIIEQFRMCRRVGPQTKITRCADQARPEMMQPDAIDQHARGERVV